MTPAEVRTALGLAPGDRLHLHLSGRRLVLERQQDAAALAVRSDPAQVLTADRAWADLDVPIQVQLLR